MARPSKKELEKREAARKQVEELFGDIITFEDKDATSVVEKIEDFKKDGSDATPSESKNIKWLEEQLKRASEENEKLTIELATKKEDYDKLFSRLNSSGVPVSDADTDSLKSGIRKLFKELEGNYTGNNPTKTPYRDVKIKAMLDKILNTFPFLIEERKRRKKQVA